VVYILEGRRIGATGGAQRGCGVKGVEHGFEHRAGPVFSLTHPLVSCQFGAETMFQPHSALKNKKGRAKRKRIRSGNRTPNPRLGK
jgi:hypothetical protein